VGLVLLMATLVVPPRQDARAAGPIVATSSSSQALQHPAQDKVAYLHDGSLLVGYFDGSRAVIDQVKNASTAPSVQQVQTISGDEVTLFTQPGSGSTDIWIQVGAELVGSASLEQVQHGTYDGTSFTWDAATSIPGAVSPGRQDPSVTWTGKWLIASWWDDTNLSNSDTVFMNWTADKTGKSGWQASAILLNSTAQNIVQVSIRHSAKLGATIIVYGAHYRDSMRTLLDSKANPSVANWTAESQIDPGYDDSEAGFGGPQVAIDETTGKIHVFRAVVNSGGPTWSGVTYWMGTPDAVPMVTGKVTWNPRLIIAPSSGSSDPPDVAGAVDSTGKVYVFWVTSASAGAIKYVTLASPYTTASAAVTLATTGTQPRYPHVPAQAPLNRGYVPVVYQSGTGSPYSIVLDTSILAAGADTAPPTVPNGLAASASSSIPRVNLSWNASSDNVRVTGYTVYRNGTVLASVSGSTLSYADNSVASLTTYSYTVDAYDAAGNHSARSSTVSVTTPDTSPPTVPSGIAAAAVSPTEVGVSWNASSDNVGVSGYTVYRNGAFLATAITGLTWADTTAAASTTYSYSVDAFDAAGNHSARSATASATTPATPDTQPPTVPAAVAAQVGPAGEVDVSWNAASDNVGVSGYTIYRGGTLIATVSAPSLAYADHTAAGLTTYTYTVDAFDAAGNHSAPSAAASVTTPDWTPPTVPAGVAATVVSGGEVALSWSASTDNVGVSGYTIYRNGVVVATTPGGTLSYADTGLGHGFTYTYTIDAYDTAGNHSSRSAPMSATTLDDIPPTTPGGLAASGTSPTAVAVSWLASTDNVGVTGYDVVRDGVAFVVVGPSPLSYTDTVTSGSTHTYTVDAFDAAGNHSAAPAAISVTTSTADTTPPSVPTGLTAATSGSTQVELGWNASTDNVGVSGYTVYRNGIGIATVAASKLSYADTTVTQGATYTYSVDAFDAAGNHSPQSAGVSVHVPGVPKFMQSAVVTTGSRVTSVTLTLGPVAHGDLLVGSFGQYDSTGQVTVSDSVNGAWTRSAATTWHGGTAPGDVALYYFANSAAAPGGLTITVRSTNATYLQAAAAEYSGVATVNPLDQAVAAQGSSTTADSGLTAAVGAGELVYGEMTASNGAGTLTPGASQGVAFVKRAQSSSGTQGEEDIVSGATGQQHAVFTFPTSTPWFVVCAVFRGA
jgi:chitodextrinase